MTEQPGTEVRGFERFVADRGQALWRAAWLLTGDTPHAEDLVQTALSKCFTRYDDIDGDESFEAYVRTAIYRTFVSWWRRMSRRIETPSETVAESATAETLSSLRIDDIARLLGVTSGTVKTHSHDPGESTPPSGSVTQPTPFETDACAGVTSGEVTSTDLPDGKLPGNPTKIWLCDASPSGMPGVVGPLEPLESVELTKGAATYYNALPTAESEPACGDDFSHAYSVIHEYADSTKYVVAVQTSSCDVITTGTQTKTGGQSYIDELVTMWQSQRDDARPVQTRPGPFCPYLGSVFPIDPVVDGFTSGVACVGWDVRNGVTAGPAEETSLPADVLAELPEQMATATTDIPDGQPIGGGIVLLAAAGDPFSLQRGENDVFSWQDSDGRWFFTPAGTLAEELEKIFTS